MNIASPPPRSPKVFYKRVSKVEELRVLESFLSNVNYPISF
jgi:hypothetical protein